MIENFTIYLCNKRTIGEREKLHVLRLTGKLGMVRVEALECCCTLFACELSQHVYDQ